MARDRAHFLLLNVGHFLDHFFTLIFATVAALVLSAEWGVGYAELLAYATPGFFAFGLFSLPAGWLADRWSRDGMMVVFFVGVGAMSILTSFAASPMQIGLGLFAIGVFAAIYHPVGMALVTLKWRNTGMRIAVNGVWGNLGVASAALVTGFLIDHGGWRLAFALPGALSILAGVVYFTLRRAAIAEEAATPAHRTAATGPLTEDHRRLLVRVGAIVFATTALTSIIFQSTTFALPKMLDEQLSGLAGALAARFAGGDVATVIGSLAFVVFAVASMAQLAVGAMLDRVGPRRVFIGVAVMQVLFFAAMPGLTDLAALAVALGFMLGAFGQIPINDYMIGRIASGPARAQVFGTRYVVGFTALALTLPLVGFVHATWGFATLYRILAVAAAVLALAVTALPRRLPDAPAAA